jgi:hypothetical protein
VGRSRSNLSQKIKQWSSLGDIEGTPGGQCAGNTKTTTTKAGMEMENNQLTPPLLDGGQGKISNIDKNKIDKAPMTN